MNAHGARTCVLIPMKAFGRAKSRLRGHLDDAARHALARSMFERVLSAARGCGRVHATYVITDGHDVAQLASRHGAEVLQDPEPALPSLGALLDWGLTQLCARGETRALVLMADLPNVQSEDVQALCIGLDAHAVVAAVDRRGHCTNALGVQLPYDTATAFGHPESYAEHRQRTHALGLSLCELVRPGLAHDVDVAADL